LAERDGTLRRWAWRFALLGCGFALAYWLAFTLRYLRDFIPHGGIL